MTVKEYASEVGCTVPVIYRMINERVINGKPIRSNGRFVWDIDAKRYPPIDYRGYYRRGRPKSKSA